jgi:hypothetical protein
MAFAVPLAAAAAGHAQATPGSLTFSSSTYDAQENAGTAPLVVQRLGGSSGAVSVDYAVTGGTATEGSDYQTVSGTLRWADGDSADKPIQVPLIDDSTQEGTETVVLTLRDPFGGATLGNTTNATLTIHDDDALPGPGTIAFTSSTFQAPENAGTTPLTVQRIGGSQGAVSVIYSVTGGTATPGADYQTVGGMLAWADGDAANKMIQVPIIDDSTGEAPETVVLTLSSPSGGATLNSGNTATLTIEDDDVLPGPGTLSFTSIVYRDREGSGGVTVTVQRTGGGEGAVSVRVAAINGGATAGVDYKLPPMRVLRWADGETAPKTLRVIFINDTIREGTERFRLMLTAPTGGAMIKAPSTATVSLLDDD